MKLKDIFILVTKTVAPRSDVHYHLYSLPSFDENQTREEVKGEDIMSNKFVVPDKCILFNKLNVRFKRVWMIDNQDSNKLASTEFLPLVVKEDKVDFRFAYYLLLSDLVTKYLSGQNSNTSGSHKRINPDVLLDININLPSRAEQERIGKLLSEFDAKIALNREINRNLEAMARQLYDYWFVQFDFPDENGKPYKSSGGKMVWNEKLKREIPEGWEGISVNELSISQRGVSFDKSDVTEFGIQVLRGNNIDGNHYVADSNIVKIPENLVSEYQHIKKYDIIMTMSSGSKEHVGKCMQFQFDSIHTFGAFLNRFRPLAHPHYLFLFLSSPYFKLKVKSLCNGTGINNLTYQNFNDIILPIANCTIMRNFDETVLHIFNHIGMNDLEIEHLTRQRDELLPLLMNGQVSVMPQEVNCDLSHD